MSNLPGEVDNLTVSVKGKKFPSRSRPIKDTKRRKELRDIVREAQMFGQQEQVAGLSRSSSQRMGRR